MDHRFLLRHARRRLLFGPMLALAFVELLQWPSSSTTSRSYLYCHAENLSTGQDVDSYVEQEIARSDVTIFAKTYCPYCKHARHLIQVHTHPQVLHVVCRKLWPTSRVGGGGDPAFDPLKQTHDRFLLFVTRALAVRWPWGAGRTTLCVAAG